MTDFILLGGASAVYEADALSSFTSSAENAQVCVLETPLVYPYSESGDVVFRRIYLSIEWEQGVSLTLLPLVDGVELLQFAKSFTRTGNGREEIGLPLNKRGGRLSLRVTSGVPSGRFAIDTSAGVMFHPALAAKALK
jgi:hypothetical protein